jgi:hypothetical protein
MRKQEVGILYTTWSQASLSRHKKRQSIKSATSESSTSYFPNFYGVMRKTHDESVSLRCPTRLLVKVAMNARTKLFVLNSTRELKRTWCLEQYAGIEPPHASKSTGVEHADKPRHKKGSLREIPDLTIQKEGVVLASPYERAVSRDDQVSVWTRKRRDLPILVDIVSCCVMRFIPYLHQLLRIQIMQGQQCLDLVSAPNRQAGLTWPACVWPVSIPPSRLGNILVLSFWT